MSNELNSEAGYTTVETTNPVGSAKLTVTSSNQTLAQLLAIASVTITKCKKLFFRIATSTTIYWAIGQAATTGGIAIVGPISWELGCEPANLAMINFIAGGNVALEVVWVD